MPNQDFKNNLTNKNATDTSSKHKKFNSTNILKICCLLFAVILAFYGISYGVRLGRYKKAVAEITFTPVDLSTISDGTYTGSYDIDFISATVEVIVKNHEITQINLLKHHNDKGDAAEVIIDQILSNQSIDVDVITGASNSSKVIKKAIECALISDIKQ